MRTYSYVRMLVDGVETSSLEIYREHNTFFVYEYDENVFRGSYINVIEYIDRWKRMKDGIIEMLESVGKRVKFEQTI